MLIQNEVVIQLKPGANKAEDVFRCLAVLYGSRVGTLALDRSFGIDWSFVDQPIPLAKSLLEQELLAKTRQYEPRAQIEQVSWESDPCAGILKPKVVVNIV